jgi:hypothetical protein
MFHTHGGFDPRYDRENYSTTDKNTAYADDLASFLATPNMFTKRYVPMPHEGSRCRCSMTRWAPHDDSRCA